MGDQKDQLNEENLASHLPDAPAALSAEERADLVNTLKSKLQDLAGQNSDFLDTLSPIVKKRVDALREIQSQHVELEAKFLEEKAVLEANYQKLYEPLYTKRGDIINGVVEVEGVFDAAAADNKDDQPLGEKGVPNFWLTAMKNNEVLAEEISERDEGALHYLKDVTWSRIDGSKGFKLAFIFNSNPYFKNSMLTKDYHMINEAEHILEKAIGTEIEWFPGKCLTQKILKKKPKKGSKNSQPITKTEDCESFFNFFSPPQVPEDEDDDVDEEAAELLQNHMEQDYDIGSTLKDKIIPHAVSWFTGEAAQYDEDEETEDDEEDDDEEEDDDAEENDEVDNEEDKGTEMIARKDGSMQTSE